MAIVDTGDELIEIPYEDIMGLKDKPHSDGSINFKMIGGPYHNMQVRQYPPFDRIVYETPSGIEVYKLHPPLAPKDNRTKPRWVYVHDMDDKRPYTKEERGR